MAVSFNAADAANHYQWRLSKPRPQTKLQSLDFAVMDQLFGDADDLPDLDSQATEHPLPRTRPQKSHP